MSEQFDSLVCQSNLKQQCQDEEGLYDWIRKDFKLLINVGMIEIRELETETQMSAISIGGAKYAKEWSYSSSLAGYGFDIVWNSGKIWSFLVDSESLCKNWVQSLNESISLLNKNNMFEVTTRTTLNVNASQQSQPKQSFYLSDSIEDLQKLRRSQVNVLPSPDSRRHTECSGGGDGGPFDADVTRVDAFTPTTNRDKPFNNLSTVNRFKSHEHPQYHNKYIGTDLSNLKKPFHDDTQSIKRTTSEDNSSQQFTNVDQMLSAGNTGGNYSAVGASLRGSTVSNSSSNREALSVFSPAEGIIQSASTPHMSQVHQSIDWKTPSCATLEPPVRDAASAIESELHNNLFRERSRCQQLERQLERHGLEADLVARQNKARHEELMLRVSELQRHLEVAKEKERSAEQETKISVETRVTRACNENNDFYEASLKASRIQHQRELTCLREELLTERKRHSTSLEKEIALRSHAEQSEQELREDLNRLQDQVAGLTIEFTRCRDTHQSETKAWGRERQQILSECESRVSTLTREMNEVQTHARQELQSKTLEMKQRYETSLCNVDSSRQESLREEFQSELLRQSNEMQKKCQRDLEAVRVEERRLAASELATLRAAFMKREHCTSEDLLQLERLHATRVGQLEEQISSLKLTNERLLEQLQDTSLRVDHGSQASEQKALQFRRQMEDHSKRAETLLRQLEAIQTELLQCQRREASYRNQLGKALDEARIKSAELVEARQQASTGSVQAQQWRKVSHESDLSIEAAQSALNIAREELSMLEFELRRAKEESAGLRQELLRADKLIFGVAQHQREPHAVAMEIENAVPRNTALNKTQGGRYPTAQHHNTVIYSTPIKLHASKNGAKKGIHVVNNRAAVPLGNVLNVDSVTPSPFAYRTILSRTATPTAYNRTKRLI